MRMYGLHPEHLRLVQCSPGTHVQDISSPSFLGGYAKGIVELPGSMNDSQERVSKDRKDGANGPDEDTRADDACPSPPPLPIYGAVAGADSSIVPPDGTSNASVERVSPKEASALRFAKTSIRNRRAGDVIED